MTFPVKTAAIYAVFATFWISLSDYMFETALEDFGIQVQHLKGPAFILFSSLLILGLLSRELRRRNIQDAKTAAGRQQLTQLSQAVSQSPVSIMITDTLGRIEYVNSAFERISGFSSDQAIGQTPRILRSNKTPAATYARLWETISSGEPWEGELMNLHPNRSSYWIKTGISPIKNADDEVTHFVSVQEDISLRKAQEHQVKHQANYDPLTELPNRFLAMDRMSQAINSAIRHEQQVVVMFIDLDNFKQINDDFGQDCGDQLMARVASRIQQTIRQTDTTARFGGDEFMVILSDLDSADDASRVAEKLLATLAEPFGIEDNKLTLTASIGIAIFPGDGQDPYELLRQADAAMFGAKDEGGNRYAFHSATLSNASATRIEIEKRLPLALENDELSLEYQPVIDSRNGKIIAVEALLRWKNPELGHVSPEQFVSLAEATGLILPIGAWVIHQALTQLKRWHDAGLTDLRLSINISPRHFGSPDLSRTIARMLEQLQLPGELLDLEVTESLLFSNQDDILKALSKLRKRGIRIVLDDFGSGQSSLTLLQRFPLDGLKINRSTISGISNQPQDRALIKATLAMAQGLGLETVAKGIETQEQLDFLSEQAVHTVQGHLYSPALSAQAFEQYYARLNR
ncbi:MAG: diguanylate cyclase (GGDEF)-like protein/PAS domain S-box-containing protein [Motiliproteus sp.]|jgi:diguanylate cyclase (GGDEF)-like protein/PAS domain S-box-containing protein